MSHKSVLYLHTEATLHPLIDLYETDDSLVFKIDLPGINPDEVLIKVYDDIVIIEGIKREINDEGRFKYICMERTFEGFRRVIKMPVTVNTLSGKASYNDGVVTLSFPKMKGKFIKIKIDK